MRPSGRALSLTAEGEGRGETEDMPTAKSELVIGNIVQERLRCTERPSPFLPRKRHPPPRSHTDTHLHHTHRLTLAHTFASYSLCCASPGTPRTPNTPRGLRDVPDPACPYIEPHTAHFITMLTCTLPLFIVPSLHCARHAHKLISCNCVITVRLREAGQTLYSFFILGYWLDWNVVARLRGCTIVGCY